MKKRDFCYFCSLLMLLLTAVAVVSFARNCTGHRSISAKSLLGTWHSKSNGRNATIRFAADESFESTNISVGTRANLPENLRRRGRWMITPGKPASVSLDFGVHTVEAGIREWPFEEILAIYAGGDPDSPDIIEFEKH